MAADPPGRRPDQQTPGPSGGPPGETIGSGPGARLGIECPHCGCPESAVIDSRLRPLRVAGKQIVTRFRRRTCDFCGGRFTTREELAGSG